MFQPRARAENSHPKLGTGTPSWRMGGRGVLREARALDYEACNPEGGHKGVSRAQHVDPSPAAVAGPPRGVLKSGCTLIVTIPGMNCWRRVGGARMPDNELPAQNVSAWMRCTELHGTIKSISER